MVLSQMDEDILTLSSNNFIKDFLFLVGFAVVIKKFFTCYVEKVLSVIIKKSLDKRRAKETCFRNMIRRCNYSSLSRVKAIVYRPRGLSHDYKLRAVLFSIWQSEDNCEKIKIAKMLITNNLFKFLGEIYCTCLMFCYLRVAMATVGGRLMARYFSEHSSRSSADLLDHLTYCDTFCKYFKPFALSFDKRFKQIKEPIRDVINQIQRNFCHEETISIDRITVLLQLNKQSLLHYSKTHMFALGPDRFTSLDLIDVSPKKAILSVEDKIFMGDMLSAVQRNLANENFRQVLDFSIQLGLVIFTRTLSDAFRDIECELKNCEYPDASRMDSFIERQPTDILHKIGLNYRRRSLVERKALVRQLSSLEAINKFALELYESEQLVEDTKTQDWTHKATDPD